MPASPDERASRGGKRTVLGAASVDGAVNCNAGVDILVDGGADLCRIFLMLLANVRIKTGIKTIVIINSFFCLSSIFIAGFPIDMRRSPKRPLIEAPLLLCLR